MGLIGPIGLMGLVLCAAEPSVRSLDLRGLLCPLTWARTSETRCATWDEFENLNGPEPLWRLSPERMKMGREHLVPLPPQAVALLRRRRRETNGDFVFPGAKHGKAVGDPFAWTQERSDQLAARAANGTSQALYTRSPGGAFETAKRVARYRKPIEAAAKSAGVNPDLLEALVFLESYRELPKLTVPRELIDSVLEMEQSMLIWRQRHARMVERVIGRRVGTGGSPGVEYLDQTALRYRIFNDLWGVRSLLLRKTTLPPLENEGDYQFRIED